MADNRYRYDETGRKFIRVTALLGRFVGDGLKNYLIKQAAQKALYWRRRTNNNDEAVAATIEAMKTNEAAEKGTRRHKILEDVVQEDYPNG